jgi:hypothetical protein
MSLAQLSLLPPNDAKTVQRIDVGKARQVCEQPSGHCQLKHGPLLRQLGIGAPVVGMGIVLQIKVGWTATDAVVALPRN